MQKIQNFFKWGSRLILGGTIMTCITYFGVALFAPEHINKARKKQNFMSFAFLWEDPKQPIPQQQIVKKGTGNNKKVAQSKQPKSNNQKVGGNQQQPKKKETQAVIKSKAPDERHERSVPVKQAIAEECKPSGYLFFREAKPKHCE